MVSLTLITLLASGEPVAPDKMSWRQQGEVALKMINEKFWIADRKVYRQEIRLDGTPSPQAAFMWDYGVLLSAYSAAAKADRRTYLPRFQRALDSIAPYWSDTPITGAYDVQPFNGGRDRYYDDNAWVALALIEAYEISRNKKHLDIAIALHKFMKTGEDDKIGGGIYWHEPKKESKHTCINAPAALTAFRLYEITKNKEFLEDGTRYFNWLNSTLRDTDGLYWDKMDLNKQIDRTKWTYNTALPIQAALAMYRITKEPKWREMALQSGRSSIAHWVTPDGSIRCDASFAHHLTESWIQLEAVDPKGPWRAAAEKAVSWAAQNTKTPAGFYTLRWEKLESQFPPKLLYQASAARAYWYLAAHPRPNK